jgi:hypothetical protein
LRSGRDAAYLDLSFTKDRLNVSGSRRRLQMPHFTSPLHCGWLLLISLYQHVGAWEPEGAEGFRAVFDSFSFDPSGTFVGTAIIDPRGTVDGDRIHGTYTVDFKSASGPSQKGVDHGTFGRLSARTLTASPPAQAMPGVAKVN